MPVFLGACAGVAASATVAALMDFACAFLATRESTAAILEFRLTRHFAASFTLRRRFAKALSDEEEAPIQSWAGEK